MARAVVSKRRPEPGDSRGHKHQKAERDAPVYSTAHAALIQHKAGVVVRGYSEGLSPQTSGAAGEFGSSIETAYVMAMQELAAIRGITSTVMRNAVPPALEPMLVKYSDVYDNGPLHVQMRDHSQSSDLTTALAIDERVSLCYRILPRDSHFGIELFWRSAGQEKVVRNLVKAYEGSDFACPACGIRCQELFLPWGDVFMCMDCQDERGRAIYAKLTGKDHEPGTAPAGDGHSEIFTVDDVRFLEEAWRQAMHVTPRLSKLSSKVMAHLGLSAEPPGTRAT
jgi:hypothetical protein